MKLTIKTSSEQFCRDSCATVSVTCPSHLETRHSALDTQHSAGFTLIELLTVIGIIGVLAGILMPALSGARDSAKKGKAQTTINSLSIALKAYYNEYGFWPTNTSSADVALTAIENKYLYLMLSGSDTNLVGDPSGPGGNPRKITFLEYKPSDIGPVNTTTYLKDTTSPTTNLVNPWGNAFRVSFDYDGDNVTTNAPFGAISASLAIWCPGVRNNTYTNMSWK